MLYKPSKKETKQLQNLNKAYEMFIKAFEIIIKNVPDNDEEIAIYAYRITKNIDGIIKRTAKIIKEQYMDRQFNDIVKAFKKKEKED